MASSPAAPAAVRPKRSWLRRWLRRLAYLVLTLVLLLLGFVVWYRASGARRLAAAVAEADRLDPGWQWEDLAAKRAAVPEDQNAAPVVLEAAGLLPDDWPPKEPPGPPSEETKPLLDKLRERRPVERLEEPLLKELREEVQKFQPALRAAHRLAGYRTGRYPDLSFDDYYLTPELKHLRQCRAVAVLLRLDAALQAEEGRAKAALASCRCLVGAGRSVGDEPSLIAYLCRLGGRQYAIQGVERTLAQVQAPEEDLAATQQLFHDEQGQDTLLMALRGDRAFTHRVMSWTDANDRERFNQAGRRLDLVGLSQREAWLGACLHWLLAGWLKENHAVMLELSGEAVEIAKLPADEQVARFQALRRKANNLRSDAVWPFFRYAWGCVSVLGTITVAETSARHRAELRCAITGLAAERFRLAHGRWPRSLDELAPRFLAAVPPDPYDGKPLKLSAFDDGILIYSVGRHGRNRGAAERPVPTPGDEPPEDEGPPVVFEQKLADWKGDDGPGFRLWDVKHRRQPPRPPLPEMGLPGADG